MNRSLRIAVADDERDVREWFQKILPLLGHEVVAVAATGRNLIECCRTSHPNLVITDVKMPDVDGIEAACEICRTTPVPIILVSAFHDPELVNRAAVAPILAFLVKPIEQADLEPAITIAVRRFEQFQTLLVQADNLRQALDDRKIIERAKGIIMHKTGFDEEQAFRRLQKVASDQNRKLVEVARTILIVNDAMTPPRTK